MTSQAIQAPSHGNIGTAFIAALMAAALYTIIGIDAYASVGTAVDNVLIQATAIVPSLGTLAIIVIGISAMFGRITWTQALVVAIGIAVASGASGVYSDITR